MADERTLIYPTLLTKANITVTIFNGEADLCVPFTDNEYWTNSMGYTEISPWTPWEGEAFAEAHATCTRTHAHTLTSPTHPLDP